MKQPIPECYGIYTEKRSWRSFEIQHGKDKTLRMNPQTAFVYPLITVLVPFLCIVFPQMQSVLLSYHLHRAASAPLSVRRIGYKLLQARRGSGSERCQSTFFLNFQNWLQVSAAFSHSRAATIFYQMSQLMISVLDASSRCNLSPFYFIFLKADLLLPAPSMSCCQLAAKSLKGSAQKEHPCCLQQLLHPQPAWSVAPSASSAWCCAGNAAVLDTWQSPL